MTRNLYRKIFITLVILSFFYEKYSAGWLYNNTQSLLNKALNIIPSISNDEYEKNIQEDGKEEGKINNDEEKKEYLETIEMHYIWIAFMKILLDYCGSSIIFPNNVEDINLEQKIKESFKEPLKNDTTLEMLSGYFNKYSLNDNFIANEKTFIQIIEEVSKKLKDENNHNLFNIISNLRNNIVGNTKKKVALSWIFTVAIGKYVAKKLSEKASQFLNDNLYGGDYIKTNTLKYIEKSFKERATLYKKLEKMFLLFYNLADNNVDNNIFINQVYENMINNLKDNCFKKSFRNLMYRNLDRQRSHINLIEIMML